MRKQSTRRTSLAQLEALLGQIDPNLGYGDWIKVLMAVCHETDGSEGGFQLVDAWSSGGQTYPGTRQLLQTWNRLDPDHEPAVTAGTLIWMARNSR